MHPQLRKSYVLLSCPILVVSDPRLSIDSQEYACIRSSMPITLVVRQAILFQNDLEKQTPVPHPYLGLGQSSCIPQTKCQSSFWFCSTLEYYPLYVRIVMRTAPTLMNFDVVILLTIISHSSALVLMQPEYRQMNCDV